MPPKQPRQEEPTSSLCRKAVDAIDAQRFGEAESILDKADERNLSTDKYIMCARSFWCMRQFRMEEAFNLASAVVDTLIESLTTQPDKPLDPDLLSLSTFLLQNIGTPAAAEKLANIYEKVIPQFQKADQQMKNGGASAASGGSGSSDKSMLENFVQVCAVTGKFKEMQKYAQELNKKSYKEPKYTMWMVFAFLMQIENRKNLTQEQSGANLQYKLALRALETFITQQVTAKEKQQKEAAANAKKKEEEEANNNKKKNNNNKNKESNSNNNTKKESPAENLNAPAISPAVCVIFVDVLLSQHKFDEAIEFLLDDAKGRFFGSWSERVQKVGAVLRKAGRIAEANSVFRHLLYNFDSDRWDVFEDYRDSTLELVSKKDATSTSFTLLPPSFHNKSANNDKDDDDNERKSKYVCEPGVSSLQQLFDDLLRLNDKILAANGKSRAPRLGAISLVSSCEGQPPAIASSEETLRKTLIEQHVKQVGANKSVLFFDLVKYVRPEDAPIFESSGCLSLAGYCNRAKMASSDSETTSFVNKCLENITTTAPISSPDNEDDAVKADVFIVASISACLRRHLSTNNNDDSTTSRWLHKATAIAHRAVKLFGINAPHITFLSVMLHRKLGSSDLESLRALDVKSIQHETIVAALQIAIAEHHMDLIRDLTDNSSTFYKTIHRECNRLIDGGLKSTSFLAFEEVFETKAKLMASSSRAESVAIDALANEIWKADTGAELRNMLLLCRNDLVESALTTSTQNRGVSNEDRVHLFAVCLHEEPRSESFTKMVDYFLSNNNNDSRRDSFSRAIASVLVTLDAITGESAKYETSRKLSPSQVPSEILLNDKQVGDILLCSAASSWLTQLNSVAVNVFSKAKSFQKQDAIAGIDSLIQSFIQVVNDVNIVNESSSSQFFFPVLHLMVLCVRVVCDRQSQGVKVFVTAFKKSLEENILAKLESRVAELNNNNKNNHESNCVASSLDTFENELEISIKEKQIAKVTREIEITQEAIKMLVMMEKLTK